MTTVLTTDTGKGIAKDATVKEMVGHLSDIRPEKAVFCCKLIVIDLLQRVKVILNTLIILQLLRLAGSVNPAPAEIGQFPSP